ncbi:hypothetical protein ABK040_001628 [Willaertia magna]
MESYQPLKDENKVDQQQQLYTQQPQFVIPQQQPYLIYNPYVIPQHQVAQGEVQQGLPQQTTQQPVLTYPPIATPNNNVVTVDAERMKQDENNSLLFLILGFFVGICWLVNYILYRNSPSIVARRNAKISLILFISVLVLTLVSLVVIK